MVTPPGELQGPGLLLAVSLETQSLIDLTLEQPQLMQVIQLSLQHIIALTP